MALCAQALLVAQEKATNSKLAKVSVPFVGCGSDGPSDPREAPKGTNTSVPITTKAAQMLASYRSPEGLSVLAPRGWYCLGLYSSGGDSLYVGPQPIDERRIGRSGFAGPIIEFSHTFGTNSRRFDVARIIARVFPAYKSSAYKLLEGFDSETSSLTFGPYPHDALTYKGKRVVEYKTPAQTDGLGTQSRLKKNGSPIEGIAILVGPTPALSLLSVRLPPELVGLASVIVHQFERDAESVAIVNNRKGGKPKLPAQSTIKRTVLRPWLPPSAFRAVPSRSPCG